MNLLYFCCRFDFSNVLVKRFYYCSTQTICRLRNIGTSGCVFWNCIYYNQSIDRPPPKKSMLRDTDVIILRTTERPFSVWWTSFPVCSSTWCCARAEIKAEMIESLPTKTRSLAGRGPAPPTRSWTAHGSEVAESFGLFEDWSSPRLSAFICSPA